VIPLFVGSGTRIKAFEAKHGDRYSLPYKTDCVLAGALGF